MEENYQETTENENTETVSGNDLDTNEPGTEEGTADDNEQEHTEDHQDNTQDKQDNQSSETETVTYVPDQEWQEEITQQLQLLKDANDNGDITERLDALIDVMTLEVEAREENYNLLMSADDVTAGFPIEGYQDWKYPVTVCSESCSVGTSGWTPSEDVFADSSAVETWYTDICQQIGVSLTDVRIVTVTDAEDNEVYHIPAETEEILGPEEDAKLSCLMEIRDILVTVQEEDALYKQAVYEYHQDMRDAQTAQVAYSAMSAIGIFIIVGILGITELFHKMK